MMLNVLKRFVIGIMLVLVVGVTSAQTQAREIVVVRAEGPVTPAFAGYINRGIRIADERNAEALVLVLDTPGGAVDTTFKLVQDMRASDVPVIVFVGPPGATAGSAGLLITLAGHAAAMAPQTAIGASSPVGPGGQEIETTLAQKQKEIIAAEARALAENRSPAAIEIVNEAVFEARAVSSSEALEAGLVDVVVEDIDALLATLNGFEVELDGRARTLHTQDTIIREVNVTLLEQFLMVVVNPNIVAALFLIGVAAVLVEVRSPGGWAAGAFGATCLGLSLYGFGVLPINGLGIVFIVMALVLFGLELAAAGIGVLAGAGVVSLIVGLIVLFQQPGLGEFGRLSIPFIIGLGVILAAVMALYLTMALRIRNRQPITGTEGLVGQKGRVLHDLDPEGTVLIVGERWRAYTADGETIPLGAWVEVVEVEGMYLTVRPVD